MKIMLNVDAEFRLSKCLVEEYALLKDVARGQSEAKDLSTPESRELGREIAAGVRYKKRMYTHFHLLG
jgi:hypothetical protein